jgi:hypothetical protein
MSTHCWVAQQSVAKRQLDKRDFRAGAMTSHFRSKGMSHVFTWLPGDELPSCQTQQWEECLWFVAPQPSAKQRNDRC